MIHDDNSLLHDPAHQVLLALFPSFISVVREVLGEQEFNRFLIPYLGPLSTLTNSIITVEDFLVPLKWLLMTKDVEKVRGVQYIYMDFLCRVHDRILKELVSLDHRQFELQQQRQKAALVLVIEDQYDGKELCTRRPWWLLRALHTCRRYVWPTLEEVASKLAAAVWGYNGLHNPEQQIAVGEIDAVYNALAREEDVTGPLEQLVKVVDGASFRETCEETKAVRRALRRAIIWLACR